MSILSAVGGWWASRRRHNREAYAENFGHATPGEVEEIRKHRHRFSALVSGSMPEGTGISPTGTPIDFEADEKPPRY